MVITKRDLELLKWINRFGYVSIREVAKYWGVSEVTAYGRMKKLVREEYLVHQRYLYQFPGLYWVSKKGLALANSELPAVRHISIATIRHQLAVVNVYLKLSDNKDIKFITERELREQTKGRHLPDGMIIKDNQKIALEVELTVKSKKRISKILNQYRRDLSYQSVWYFCGDNQVMNHLNTQAKEYSFLKVYPLAD